VRSKALPTWRPTTNLYGRRQAAGAQFEGQGPSAQTAQRREKPCVLVAQHNAKRSLRIRLPKHLLGSLSSNTCRLWRLVSRRAAIESGRLKEHKEAPRAAALLHSVRNDHAVKAGTNAGSG